MKHIKLFKTEAEYENGVTALPCVSYVESTEEVHFDEKHAVDRIYNAPLMNMMYGLGLAENQNYMTYEEAARVPSLNTADFATYEVISAWELKYFTGLVEFPRFVTGTYSLQELYIPDHIATLQSSTLTALKLNKLHLPEALIAIPSYGLGAAKVQDSILYIGANIASDAPNNTYANGWGTIICMSPAFKWQKENRPVNTTTIYVKDEYVNDYKAVAPWNTWGTVKPLSEYTGDTDY